MEGHRHMLFVANGSPAALDEALRLADQGNCWVTVLTVLPAYDGDLDLTGVRNLGEVVTSDRKKEAQRLAESIRSERSALVRVEHGGIPETIGKVAAEEGSDFIVIGLQNNAGPIRRRMDGRLLRKITKTAPCPVMVVDA